MRTAESGNAITYHFCPICGSTLYWENDGLLGQVTVAGPCIDNHGMGAVTSSMGARHFMATGRRDDLVRRTLTCNLVADRERPELRRFERDPVADVVANRGAYLAACLTIVRAYQAADSPDVSGPIGSYGEWSAVARAPPDLARRGGPA
jgi:hypothetical protein